MVSHSIESQTTSIHNLKCKYSYRKCLNHRATKRDGTLHTLCEYHRVKANTLQQVYAKKKKEAAAMANVASFKAETTLFIDIEHHIDNFVSSSWLHQINFATPCELTEEDCRMIRELF
ncbi:Aste57867_17227 [Aphanomyces stellatus]|uniref:Aste57867_17227 protein n=1 Tax=Aphanomyces stellatus TaxID=120398 RepID=A0A485L875_9STRA|nr:hypothetical protein As57867_017168 [Aphanomyces stellatus]VFT93984.1 Aste57867_17227 [Aphanomyces stellatus]